MRPPIPSKWPLGPTLAALLPLGLWAMLWLGISPGDRAAILNPGSPTAFAQGLRAVFPLMAGGAAVIIIGVKVAQRSPRGFGFFGPLGLATVYGLVGLAAALKSPDGSVALWWSALYLSVPIVLLGIVWSADPLVQLRGLVNATWLAIILAAVVLFVVAGLYLNLVDHFLDPQKFLTCGGGGWFDFTGERLRDTGVGRYAAIAGIISISGLWQRKWRTIWIVVVLISLILLLFSGARGSFFGFGAGAALVLLIYLIHAGKGALLAGLLVTVVIVSAFWSTGGLRTFLDFCIFRGVSAQVTQTPASGAALATSLNPPGDSQPTAPATVVAPPPPSATATAVAPPATSPLPGSTQPSAPATAVAPPATTALPAASQATISATAVAPPATSALPGASQATIPATAVAPLATPALFGAPQATIPAAVVSPASTAALSGASEPTDQLERPLIPKGFYTLSGRTGIWVLGLQQIKSSPAIGFGFHADRLLLGTHMHNSVLHSLLQAGIIGAIPFVAAVIFAWVLFFRIVRKPSQLSGDHKHLVIQCGGVLAFLTMRSLPESTGAFFGVDWLILALILFYLQVVNYRRQPLEVDSDRGILEGA